ncbi:PIR protein [Plasmodium ovale]|uniref:PIR protein n=1 Tax=Plasmodium ovale TaxID=36330 RepID=A0A1D3JEH2_PLAOA|nr:PIR protein [Plasmodium ovale]
MPSPPKSTSFLKLLSSSSKELISEKFYDAMNNDSLDLSKYDHECNNIRLSTKKNEVKTLCKKVLKYLEESEEWEENKSGYDDCILLNYWLYYKLSEYFVDNKDYINFAYASIENIWSNLVKYGYKTSYYKKCKPLYLNILIHDDWKKGKEFYDYCINYNTIVPLCKSFDETCMEHYEYIEKKSSLYEYFGQICDSRENNCPYFYENCKAYNPKPILHTLKCHDTIVSQRAASEMAAKADAIQHPTQQVLGSGSHASDTASTPETSNIGTKFGHSVLGVAPVLLSATALYRYTPVGSWIRKLGGTNPNSMRDMEEFSSYTQESGDMFSDNATNYISYQSL